MDLGEAGSEELITKPWDNFAEWLHCVCVVTFDLELGQALECIYPHHTELSETERSNICYLAFPDSNSGCMGDTEYSFRIRKTQLKNSKKWPDFEKDCPVTLLSDPTHLYGYVFFRQVRDKTLRRGYFQKSVVLLSSLPYFKFFKDIADIIAPEYFDNGELCLEAACHDIDRWPSPVPGKTLNLPLMGMVLHVRIPTKQDKPGTAIFSEKENNPQPFTYSSISEVDLMLGLGEVLPHIHMLWELVLLGEPIVVMGPSPSACSATVLCLVSCINPLRYYCDYRPYFTIHDSEFKEYTTRTQAPPPVIIGVTNPFFAKTLQHWPHIIRVGDLGSKPSIPQNSLLSVDSTRFRKTSKLKVLDPKPGVYTKYKPLLKKDKAFFKALTKEMTDGKSNRKLQSSMMRRNFLELTQSFIIPLERYLASLMPLQKNISPLKAPPTLKPFRADDFIQTVESNGPQLTSGTKGDWIGLYKKFLHSGNFDSWLKRRRAEMEAKVASLHLTAFSQVDLGAWAKNKSEIELVDMVLRIQDKIRLVTSKRIDLSPNYTSVHQRLQQQLSDLKQTLPPDLKGIILND